VSTSTLVKTLAIIPARYASTRFPGKPLVEIAGKSMIQHVWERAMQTPSIDEVLVATDDQRILDAVEKFGAEGVLTSTKHKTGTDRIIEALSSILPGFNKKLVKFAHNKLEKNGIKILLDTIVSSFDGKIVIVKKSAKSTSTVKSKIIIPSYTLVWAAGVTPVEIIKKSIFKTMKGQIIVNEFLEIPNFSSVFAIGDICTYPGKLKLILSGYHEGALAARACFKLARPNEKYRFEFTTTSKSMQERLGIKKSD